MKRLILATALLTIGMGLTGCASINDGFISCEMSIRNQILAQKAWGHWSWCYGELDYPFHFATGFKAGYRDILDGGNGCQPTLPPQCYWKPDFQTPTGNCQIHSWFDGFSHGALAAKQDGYGGMGEIPISPTARANMETAARAKAARYSNNDMLYPQAMPGVVGEGMIGLPEVTPGVPPSLPGIGGGDAVTPPTRPYE